MGFLQKRLLLTSSADESSTDGQAEKMKVFCIDCRDFLDKSYDKPVQTNHEKTAHYVFKSPYPAQGFLDMGYQESKMQDGEMKIVETVERLGFVLEQTNGFMKFYEVFLKDTTAVSI